MTIRGDRRVIGVPTETIRDSSGTIRALLGWLSGSLRGLFGSDYKGSSGDYLGVSAPALGWLFLVTPGQNGVFGA